MIPKVEVRLGGPSDFADYLQIKSSLEDMYWMGFDKSPEPEKLKEIYLNRIHSAQLTKNNDKAIFIIRYYNDNSKLNVGYIQAILNNGEIELGYSVLKEYQNLGISTEALKQIIKLYDQKNIQIIAKIRDDNIASQKCALKLNFIKTNDCQKIDYPIVGDILLRRYLYLPGSWKTVQWQNVIFGILTYYFAVNSIIPTNTDFEKKYRILISLCKMLSKEDGMCDEELKALKEILIWNNQSPSCMVPFIDGDSDLFVSTANLTTSSSIFSDISSDS